MHALSNICFERRNENCPAQAASIPGRAMILLFPTQAFGQGLDHHKMTTFRRARRSRRYDVVTALAVERAGS